MEWQPIETAPRDGSVFLAWRYFAVALRWTGEVGFPWEAVEIGSKYFRRQRNGYQESDPALTHWMPLPSKPR